MNSGSRFLSGFGFRCRFMFIFNIYFISHDVGKDMFEIIFEIKVTKVSNLQTVSEYKVENNIWLG